MSEKPVKMSYEDEAPVAYDLEEGEPLVATVRTPVLTPGKTGELTPEPTVLEWIGSVLADYPGLTEPMELKVLVDGGRVAMGRFTFSLEEAITLACTLMDACHFIVRMPHRARVEAELVALRQECEEAPV